MENKNKQEAVGIAGFIVSFFLPLIGLILSIIGVSKANKNGNGKGLAVAGIIISSLLMLFRIILLFILFVFGIFVLVDETSSEGHYNSGNVCSKAYNCNKLAGNMYECKYKNKNIEKNVYCFDNALSKEQIIKAEDNNQNKKDIVDLKDIEEYVSRHYMKYYDGLMDHAKSRLLNNNVVEVTIYSDEEETKPGLVYTINRETLIGKDSHNYYVDLNEFSENIDDFNENN